MGHVQKAFIIMLCMNLFLYVYLPFGTSDSELLDQFVNLQGEGNRTTVANSNITGSIPTSLSESSAVVGTDSLTVYSALKTAWDIIKEIFKFLFAPVLVINMIPEIPTLVGALFILPNLLVIIFGTISFIKGYDW